MCMHSDLLLRPKPSILNLNTKLASMRYVPKRLRLSGYSLPLWPGWTYCKTTQAGNNLPLVSREWKNGSNSGYNCTPFLHSLLTEGKYRGRK